MNPNNDTPSIRFAGFTGTWEQRKLETICSVSSGANTAHEEDGKYFNLTMGSVSEDGQIMYSLKTNETSRLLSKGQLIMPTRDVGKGLIIGRTAYVSEDNRFYAGNCLYILTVNGDLDSKFLSYFINSNYVRQQFARVVSGGGQKQITLTDVSELTIS
ncbi:MAG: restriction endonuclease subunit S, partial [Akkermansia sp.]|nr:restriction endonuclease subunit S [Akkermansia sp.]